MAKKFSEKVKDARCSLGLSRSQLSELIGVSVRSIASYEDGIKLPRQLTLIKLAKALQVSVTFLSDDSCMDPMKDIEKDVYIEEARERYGSKGVMDVEHLLSANEALFAGGELSQDQKDQFFDAIMTAYVTCKEEARRKFGRKNEDPSTSE